MASLQRILGYSVVFFLLFVSDSLTEQTHKKFYTIQTGSFIDEARAVGEFNLILQRLNKDELEYLRIERIGEYYTVRLGRFEDEGIAKEFHERIRVKLPDSIIVEAYIIEERIVKQYTPEKSQEGIKHPDGYIKRISDLVNMKDYEGAIEEVKIAMKERQDDPELNAWHGAILLKMNKASEALPYLRKATSLSPDKPDYHNTLGYCLFFLKRFDEAIEEFNNTLKLNPSHVDALTGLAISYARIGKMDKAMEIQDRLKRVDKETAERLLKIITTPSN